MPEETDRNDFGTKTRQELVLQYAPFIRHVAHRLELRLPPSIDINDIIHAGIIGLIDAIEKFDTAKGVKFSTYAEFRIKGSILDSLRHMDWVPRSIRKLSSTIENVYAGLEKKLVRPATDEEVAEAMGIKIEELHDIFSQLCGIPLLSLDVLSPGFDSDITLLDCIADSETKTPLSQTGVQEIRDMVADAIENLPEKEKIVISLYYFDELTMKQISAALDLTESRISQLHTKAVLRLRSRLKDVFDISKE